MCVSPGKPAFFLVLALVRNVSPPFSRGVMAQYNSVRRAPARQNASPPNFHRAKVIKAMRNTKKRGVPHYQRSQEVCLEIITI